MKQMPWTGNLRELRNVIRRCVLFAEGDYIEAEDLPVFPETIEKPAVSNDDYALRPGNEREQIEAALAKARGNKTVAARLLQIDRKTLYNKMHQLGLEL
jgi:two-component system response regulator HydG